MTKSTPPLTQSGLLAVLLQRRSYRVFQLARRSAHRKPVQAVFWNTLTWARRQSRSTGRATLESFTRPIAMSHQTHNYTDLRQQIHNDLRIKYPEWVEPNGESTMCDSYDMRLLEQLNTLTRRGSNESIAGPHHGEPSSGLKHGLHARKGDFPSQ
jgi:hypothetical protein